MGGGVNPLGGGVNPLGGGVSPLGGGVDPLGGSVNPLGGCVNPLSEGVNPRLPLMWLMASIMGMRMLKTSPVSLSPFLGSMSDARSQAIAVTDSHRPVSLLAEENAAVHIATAAACGA
eukprot:8253407-Pyramimonas_sp.AAC.1